MNVWLQRALLAFGITAGAVIFVGLLLGRTWHVEVRETIAAPPAVIHPWVDDLRRWQSWAGWNAALDPDVHNDYSGPDHGVGATWAWQGPKMGRGRMRIERSEPEAGVWIVEAIESDDDNAKGSITFHPVPDGTEVVWTDEGKLPPIIGGFFRKQIQTVLGEHFRVGLRTLKRNVEAERANATP